MEPTFFEALLVLGAQSLLVGGGGRGGRRRGSGADAFLYSLREHSRHWHWKWREGGKVVVFVFNVFTTAITEWPYSKIGYPSLEMKQRHALGSNMNTRLKCHAPVCVSL